jgi:hypothetical protein
MNIALMLATGVPTAYWDAADDAEIATVLELLEEQTAEAADGG